MPELRKDPISGRWVIISVERGKRPTDFVSPSQKRKAGGFCPFCPGNEHMNPQEIYVVRTERTPSPAAPGRSDGWTERAGDQTNRVAFSIKGLS